jgi:hypothetical protein
MTEKEITQEIPVEQEITQDVQTEQLTSEISDVGTVDPQQQMKDQYLAYMNEIKEGRFVADTREQVIENLNILCKLFSLTTVIPKTETRAYKDDKGKSAQQQVIVGGTPIDLIKSQYPGVYPILMERMLELAVKL